MRSSTEDAMKPLLTVEQVADLLAVPVQTIYRWRYRGEGPPAIRVGKYLRYNPDALARWIDGRNSDASPAV
jgi:excisionase family DNA binding protein